jgi:hypothetical protein
MKISPLAAVLSLAGGYTDRQTDMKNLIVAFRNFLKAPKNKDICVSLMAYSSF